MGRTVGRADTAAGSDLEPQDAAIALDSGSLLSSLGRGGCCWRDVSAELLLVTRVMWGRQSIPVNLASALFIG